jgi:multicomponent Na+:H+ antiporter subunit B
MNKRPYFESPIVATAVRLIAPFTLTYGIFVTLHGADSPGGGFQGGVIIASTVIMIAFAFGVKPSIEWADERVIAGLFAGGVLAFGAAALVTLPIGDSLLRIDALPGKTKYGVEIVEVFISGVVAGVVTSLFFMLAEPGGEEE